MRNVREIEIILKSEPGRFSGIVDLLDANNIGIIAFYISAEGPESKFHFIAHDPDKARQILDSAGYKPLINDVIACELPKHPGGLNAILRPIKAAGVHIRYLYPCLTVGPVSVLILSTDRLPETITLLQENWIRMLGEEIYHL